MEGERVIWTITYVMPVAEGSQGSTDSLPAVKKRILDGIGNIPLATDLVMNVYICPPLINLHMRLLRLKADTTQLKVPTMRYNDRAGI